MPNFITGTAGDDRLIGTSEADVISGGAGNDTISDGFLSSDGQGGEYDRFYGEEGDDVISIAGGDFFSGATLDGGAGNDEIRVAGDGAVYCVGGSGDDTLVLRGSGMQTVDAGAGADDVEVGSGRSMQVSLGEGADTLRLDVTGLRAASTVLVTDYEPGVDYLDLGLDEVSSRLGGRNPFEAGYVRLVQLNADTIIQLDRADTFGRLDAGNGSDSLEGYYDAVRLAGVSAASLTAQDFGGYAPLFSATHGTDENDYFVWPTNVASIFGGAGSDTLDLSSAPNSLEVDLVHGSVRDIVSGELIIGISSIENVIGGSGFNRLFGDENINILIGGDGTDQFRGSWDDLIEGGGGVDSLTALSDHNWSIDLAAVSIEWFFAGGGNDFVDASHQIDRVEVYGRAGNDILIGSPQFDRLDGGSGDDIVYGGDGVDEIFGGAGADSLFGGGGDDSIPIDADDVFFDGGDGRDTLICGGAENIINLAATHFEVVFGSGGGNDVFDASQALTRTAIFAGAGDDWVFGSAFGDQLWGGSGNDVIHGCGGSDWISAEDGNDTVLADSGSKLDGGAGTDILYVTAGTGILLNLPATSFEIVCDLAGGNDTLDARSGTTDVVIFAGGGNDHAWGGRGNDFLWGEAGSDSLVGGSGSDVLVGGTGSDRLTGGEGNDAIFCTSGQGGDGAADTIEYAIPGWGTDFVYDFELGLDKIDLSGTGATAASVSINVAFGNAIVEFGGAMIVVVGAGAGFTMGDLQL